MAENTIKSVRRVFEILELFDKERQPLAAKDIAKKLGYPLVSAHALLKSMHELGYADFDAPSWTYIPSRNFIAVLDWVPDLLERERNLLDFVEALNRQTMETVNVSRRVNTQIRIMHGLESIHTVGVNVRVGAMMPVTGSLTGLTALAGMPDDERGEFLDRLVRDDPAQAEGIDRAVLQSIVDELKSVGTATKSDVFIPGVGAVCFPVYTKDEREQLVIGVVGPTDRISQSGSDYRKAVKQLVKEYHIKTVLRVK
ncbi:IclR family transcriptional regulator [Erythrobacter sp. W53]|uniref:IclR family transcriptional regulator n=1 Tax=Erythrobacter sp. W53 TaxID=3425947 RepID=UPI003D767E41